MVKLTANTSEKIVEKKLIKEASREITRESLEKGSKAGLLSATKLAANRLLIQNRHQFIKTAEYNAWLINPENLSKLKLGYAKDGTLLRNNMKVVMGSNYEKYAGKTSFEAHHLVSADSRYPSSEISQRVLKKYKIDINDPMNGVLLPRDVESTLKGTIHRGGHTKAYNDLVAQRLQAAKSKEQCYEVLDIIKNDLYQGKISLYNNLKVNTVKSSFK